jgi:hypothetical protein
MFDTEKPPVITHSDKTPVLVLSFDENPEAKEPYQEWVDSGEAWDAFGLWYDTHYDRM